MYRGEFEQKSAIEKQAAKIDASTPHGRDQLAIFSAIELARINKAPVDINRGVNDEYVFVVDFANQEAVIDKPVIEKSNKEIAYGQAGILVARQAVEIVEQAFREQLDEKPKEVTVFEA